MEGKEVRFGIANSSLWATATTAASNGSVNCHARQLHAARRDDSDGDDRARRGHLSAALAPASTACCSIVIVAVFIAGLMVGRTPEYLGKKLEAKEVKMAMLAMLILPLSMLGLTAAAAVIPVGVLRPTNAGPHGFSEMLYAYVVADRQ